jgi:hypothetical protein
MPEILQESVNFANRRLTEIVKELDQIYDKEDLNKRIEELKETYNPYSTERINQQENLNPEIHNSILIFALRLIRKELNRIWNYTNYTINTQLTTKDIPFNNNPIE